MNNKHNEINSIEENEFLKRAPKVWGMVVAAVPSEDLNSVAAIFNKIALSGALESAAILREKGVSFNPRPARILEILIKEGGHGHSKTSLLATIRASLLVNLLEAPPGPALSEVSETSGKPILGGNLSGKGEFSNPELPTLWESNFQYELNMAKAILTFEAQAAVVPNSNLPDNNLGFDDINPAPFSLGIGLSRALDSMRHAHMSDPMLFNKDKNIHIAMTLLELSKKNGSDYRLATLLETATIRFKNRR